MYSSRNMVVITELDEVSLSLVKYWVAICLWRLLKFVISLILLLHDWSSWLWCDIFWICMIGLCKIYHIFLWVIEPNFTQQNTNTFLWPGHSTLNSEWPGASVLWTHVDCIFMKKVLPFKALILLISQMFEEQFNSYNKILQIHVALKFLILQMALTMGSVIMLMTLRF